jgi:hypothetical protein
MAQRGTTAHIDLKELEKLAMLQCTDEEIAAWFGVTTKTIQRRRQNPKFAEVIERGKSKGRISVRRMQMKLLEAGNATMGVWLGKNILGQVDEVTFGRNGAQMIVIMPTAASIDMSRAGRPDDRVIDIGGGSVVQCDPAMLEAGESVDSTSLRECARDFIARIANRNGDRLSREDAEATRRD